MFFFCTLQDNENADHFEFVFEENSDRKSHDYFDVIVFEKPRFQKVLCPHSNKKPVFSYSSCLKSIFKLLHFHDRLVLMVGLRVELKPIFVMWMGLNINPKISVCYSSHSLHIEKYFERAFLCNSIFIANGYM